MSFVPAIDEAGNENVQLFARYRDPRNLQAAFRFPELPNEPPRYVVHPTDTELVVIDMEGIPLGTLRVWTMFNFFARMAGDRKGVTAMEYALIAALIAMVIIGGVSLLGTDVSQVFSTAANTI